MEKLTYLEFNPNDITSLNNEVLIREINDKLEIIDGLSKTLPFDKLILKVFNDYKGDNILIYQFILKYKDRSIGNGYIKKLLYAFTDNRYLLYLLKDNILPLYEKQILELFIKLNNSLLGDFENMYVDLRLKYPPFGTKGVEGSNIYENRDLNYIGNKENIIRLLSDKRYASVSSLLIFRLQLEDIIELYKTIDDELVKCQLYKSFSLLASIKERSKLLSSNPFKHIEYRMIADPSLNTRRVAINKIGVIPMEVIDPTITIGVELECVNKNSDLVELILSCNKFLKDWTIQKDGSVFAYFAKGNDNKPAIVDGVEFVSPILTYDTESLKELKAVCNALKKLGFFTNETCGGHIHLGYNYFKTKGEFLTFINLYGVCERFLYLASNRASTSIRCDALENYAKSNKRIIENLVPDLDYIQSLSDFEWEFSKERKYDNSRYHGLNLTNIGHRTKNTIEFRMPNGEIDFINLKLNIELFCKLIMKSKEIANTDSTELLKQYRDLFKNRDEDNLIEKILELLFDNEKQREIYRKRYYTVRDKTKLLPRQYYLDLENFIDNNAKSIRI